MPPRPSPALIRLVISAPRSLSTLNPQPPPHAPPPPPQKTPPPSTPPPPGSQKFTPPSKSAQPSTLPRKATRSARPKRPPPLQVTNTARTRLHHLISKRDPRPSGIRIGLRTRGCNGMAYTLNYIDQPSPFDERVDIGQDAAVYVDPRALMHIVGTTMDFVDNDLVSEFIFANPNAKGTCGCGESFNV